MADEADIAAGLADAELASNLALHAKQAKATALVARGACHYCGTPVDEADLFCDADCCSDWDREAAILRKQGRKPTSARVLDLAD